MPVARITGVSVTALLEKSSVLEATLTQPQGNTVICEVSWPKKFDDTFLEITSRVRHLDDPRRSAGPVTRMTLRLPNDVDNLVAADAWFRTQFGTAIKVPNANWTLLTPRGVEITIRQAMDEPLLVIQRAGGRDWTYGELAVELFVDELNRSPLCLPGTATYVGSGSVEVYLSAAALKQEEPARLLKLAELYR